MIEDLAGGAGVDVPRMVEALDAGRYEEALASTTRSAAEMGITGTPTFVFGGRYAAVGAQPTELLLRTFDAVLKDREEG